MLDVECDVDDVECGCQSEVGGGKYGIIRKHET